MVTQLLIALIMMAVCVVIHATGIASAVRRLRRQAGASPQLWSSCWLFVRMAAWMVLLHLGEISAWALLYTWQRAIPDATAALYFSAVTFTTTGYGDVVLPQQWRLVGAVEALTGILMCGWSTGFFFAALNRVVAAKTDPTVVTP